MAEVSFETRRGELQTYFDRTAKDSWVALTSNSPVSRIRETVRRGREEMRNTILSWLPQDMSGVRLLDAGCGTGMLAIEAAKRGADIVAIDISPKLIEEARLRTTQENYAGKIEFYAGDMTDPDFGSFDYVVAMDSVIHYPLPAMTSILEGFAERTTEKLIFTFAPYTLLLGTMKAVGKFFPRNDRSPAIEPVRETDLREALVENPRMEDLKVYRTKFVSTGFYKSKAMELTTT